MRLPRGAVGGGCVGDDVDVVGALAAAHHHVQRLGGGGVGDQAAGGGDGAALRAVHGAGVGQLHVRGHVGRGKLQLTRLSVRAGRGDRHDGQRPVPAAFGDAPGVAVGDEPLPRFGPQAAFVEAGDDQVADAGPVAVGQLDAVLFDEPALDEVGAGAGRQGRRGGLGVGHQQRHPRRTGRSLTAAAAAASAAAWWKARWSASQAR